MNIKIPFNVKYILDKLTQRGFESFIVGGCVRDSLLGLKPKDWDITTNATPPQIKAVFKTDKVVSTGERYGTLTVILDDSPYEVTTYRYDGTYGDGRRPNNVTFGKTIFDDLARRDFTINAMAYSESKGLIDIYGGCEDLENKTIKAVGNPHERFNEDGLRILRAIRFSTRLNFTIEPTTINALQERRNNLLNVSSERVAVELEQILANINATNYKPLYDLIQVVIPEFECCKGCEQNKYHVYDVGNHIFMAVAKAKKDKIVRLATLFHDIGKPKAKSIDSDGNIHFYDHAIYSAETTEIVLKRLKFDNDTIYKVKTLVRFHNDTIGESKKSVKKLINSIGENLFHAFIEVKRADTLAQNPIYIEQKQNNINKILEIYNNIKEENECFTLKQLAINGNDLIEIGFTEGKTVGKILNFLLESVISEKAQNNKQDLINLVSEIA